LANTYTEDLDEVTNNVVVLGERGDGEDIAYD
jgi:hypothetical protein